MFSGPRRVWFVGPNQIFAFGGPNTKKNRISDLGHFEMNFQIFYFLAVRRQPYKSQRLPTSCSTTCSPTSERSTVASPTVYTEKDSDLASLLDGVPGVPNGERQFWMTVTTPLPSYGIIDGKRVKIFHVGQARTCARCHCTRDVCPGQANARQCEDNGGEKKNLEDSHATLFSVVVVQVMGKLSDKGQLMRWFVETSMLAPQFPRITNSKMTSLGKYLSIVCFIFGCPKAAL